MLIMRRGMATFRIPGSLPRRMTFIGVCRLAEPNRHTPITLFELNKLIYSHPDIPLAWSKKLDSIWPDLMEEIAALSSNSTLIIMKNTSHNIPKENPNSVVDAVRLLTGDD
ncbi:MAG: hypothetical protein E4H27_00420 [Anaerolineales bacterium]|nr:MAG: hypothetical protein E4H27_00420 [Anaerolineales bacterium]